MIQKINKAMILCAGLGSRLKPITIQKPKALVEINKKTLLQRNVEYLQSFGITDLIINVHHLAKQIIDTVEENKGWGSNISISQEDSLLDTGGGVKKAAPFFSNEKHFLVMNVDILTNLNINNMFTFHCEQQADVTLAVSTRHSHRVFLLKETNNQLCGWKNTKTGELKTPKPIKTAINTFAFSGVHILNTSMIKELLKDDIFSIIDFYINLSQKKNIIGYDHSNDMIIDVGKPEKISIAEKQVM